MEREKEKSEDVPMAIHLHEVLGLELDEHKLNYRAWMYAHYSLSLTRASHCQKEWDREVQLIILIPLGSH